MLRLNNSLLYLLIFTVVVSGMAYGVVIKAYDSVYEIAASNDK